MATSAAQSGTGELEITKAPPPRNWRRLLSSLLPWLWILPAVVVVAVFLVYPVIYTFWSSLFDATTENYVGLKNYQFIFTNQALLQAVRNNLIWLVLGTIFTVLFGLIIAVLMDRTRIEPVAKSAIFIPMAISFVGAGVIWKFIYNYNAPGTDQIGLLNAIITRFGGQPQAWLINQGSNNLALIAVYVWIWAGFCMVILSAALKGIPADVLEAARVDGASEINIFFRVIIPLISPTIAVVATTMIINLLKIFDIVYVMTGGNFGTDVVAEEYYKQLFSFLENGRSSALAVLLMLAVIPVMIFNVYRFRQQEAQR